MIAAQDGSNKTGTETVTKTGLNVEMVNSPVDMGTGADELLQETTTSGKLNVEMNDNTSTMENALDVETRDTNMQGDTQDWQDDIEHLKIDIEGANRNDAAMGLLLLSSPKSTHGTDVEDDLMDNANLLPVDTTKLPDLVAEMDNEKQTKTTQDDSNDEDSDNTIVMKPIANVQQNKANQSNQENMSTTTHTSNTLNMQQTISDSVAQHR